MIRAGRAISEMVIWNGWGRFTKQEVLALMTDLGLRTGRPRRPSTDSTVQK
jgi:hypothetical protein